jgi:hypothetical protein
MRKCRHDAGLRRDLDEVAATGGVAMVERNECADRGLCTRPGVGLRLADPDRHAARLARERHGAAGGHDLEIAPLPSAARTGTAERPNRDDDQPRIIRPQRIWIEIGTQMR